MHRKTTSLILFVKILVILLLVSSCSTSAPPAPTSTSTPEPTSTATKTATPTATVKPTSTPRPTKTPNLAATQRVGELQEEAQSYFEQGYLESPDGQFEEYDDFNEEWAQLGWYSWWPMSQTVRDFYLTAHFKWSSAYRNADISGCGFAFAIEPDDDHYAVFLDQAKVYFVDTTQYYWTLSPVRGTGRVEFGNPFDEPVETDFTLIVKGTTAYVLVDDVLVGEYVLSQSKNLRGGLGLTLLSGTNKDYGTRCEMTNIHVWTPIDG